MFKSYNNDSRKDRRFSLVVFCQAAILSFSLTSDSAIVAIEFLSKYNTPNILDTSFTLACYFLIPPPLPTEMEFESGIRRIYPLLFLFLKSELKMFPVNSLEERFRKRK